MQLHLSELSKGTEPKQTTNLLISDPYATVLHQFLALEGDRKFGVMRVQNFDNDNLGSFPCKVIQFSENLVDVFFSGNFENLKEMQMGQIFIYSHDSPPNLPFPSRALKWCITGAYGSVIRRLVVCLSSVLVHLTIHLSAICVSLT